ncbi:MAG: FAD-binding oxidoreductase [Proteobacteria bacterium]|nr:FAD-binding oxidoreductase [Pseudomonadota bacterium]
MKKFDFVVIGAGVAGASAAYELASHGRVALLEREDMPGYHSTGRSAALFTATYGNAVIRGLTVGSRSFFENPPDGFTEHPLLTPRGAIFIGREDQRAQLDEGFADSKALTPSVELLDQKDILARVPVLDPGYVAGGIHEPECMDMDVHAIHQGFLKLGRSRGVALAMNAEATSLSHKAGAWQVTTPAGVFSAPVVINAAGAWSDEIAKLARLAPLGLVPKRRTVMTFRAPDGTDPDPWPAVIDIEEEFYFKPDAGLVLGSPADETPSPPCDAQPEELDIALAIDRIERATTMKITRIEHKWAGLRTFAPDKTIVAGFDPGADGFFWLAGQGGYGIMTSPAMSRITASLARGGDIPAKLTALGVHAKDLTPGRFPRDF